MTELVRGQRAKLADLGLGGGLDLDLTVQVSGLDRARLRFLCLVLDRDEAPVADRPLVHSKAPQGPGGAVVALEREPGRQRFAVDLGRSPPEVGRYLFFLSIDSEGAPVPYHAESVREGSVTIASKDGRVLATYRFRGGDFGKESAVHLVDLYYKDSWRCAVVGGGFVGGLGPALSRHGVSPELIATVAEGASLLLPSGGPGLAASGGTLRNAPGHWPGRRPPQLPGDLVHAVGLMVVEREQKAISSGTGFLISPGGHFLTCNHVVDGAVGAAICLEGTEELRPVEVLQVDADRDVALCWISDRAGATDWFLLGDVGTAPTLGLELGLLGYPLGAALGLGATYSQGIVNSVRRYGELDVLQIDAGAAPGSSGGPVFRRSDGRVVGMLTSGIDLPNQGMHINFAIDMRAVLRLGWTGRPGP